MNDTISPDHLQSEAQSPYLPGTHIQFAWDSTSLGLAKTCPRLYQYTMIDGWGSRDESIHLRFGIEYHKALEDYDRLRALALGRYGHDEAVEETIYRLMLRIHDWRPSRELKAGHYKNENSILQLVIDYLDHFNDLNDDPAETLILDNGKPAVELSFRFELDFGPSADNPDICPKADECAEGKCPCPCIDKTRQPYLLSGHLDRVVIFNGAHLVMDRKTSLSTIGSYYFKQYEPHNQMTLYTLAGKIILNTPIKGVVIDAAQVKLKEPNAFARGFTYRTPGQLEEWVTDLRILFQTFESYAVAGYWPMNDTACDKFGGCKFREICSKDPSVRERFLKSDFDKLPLEERWNPLKPR